MVADTVPGLRKPAAQWVVENPILSSTQIGQETDTLLVKRGNDIDPWNSLLYDNTIIVSADGQIIATPRMRAGAQSAMLNLVSPLTVAPFTPGDEPPPGETSPFPAANLYPSTDLYPSGSIAQPAIYPSATTYPANTLYPHT